MKKEAKETALKDLIVLLLKSPSKKKKKKGEEKLEIEEIEDEE